MKKEKKEATGRGVISLKTVGLIITLVGAVITGALITSLFLLSNRYRQVIDSTSASDGFFLLPNNPMSNTSHRLSFSKCKKMAPAAGFEPAHAFSTPAGFRNRSLQPLE